MECCTKSKDIFSTFCRYLYIAICGIVEQNKSTHHALTGRIPCGSGTMEGVSTYMTTSDAQKRAVTKYDKKAYDKLILRFSKDGSDGFPTRQDLADFAALHGMSSQGFIKAAIIEKMDRMSGKA